MISQIENSVPQNILVIGAHSDDIEIGCFGTLQRLTKSGCNIHLCVLSGDETRKAEFLKSCDEMKDLGITITTRHCLDFQDGCLHEDRSEIKNSLKEIYDNKDIAVVFTHSRNDLHQDHRLVSQITLEVFRNCSILGYEIPKYDGNPFHPQLYVKMTEEQAKLKITHLVNNFASQEDKYWYNRTTFEATLILRGVESKSSYAEAFEVVKWLC